MVFDPMEFLYTATTWVIPLILAIVLHEIAHGYMAYKLGDTTAKRLGRLSLNPQKHIDPIGSLLVPGILLVMKSPVLIGWAKPVPVDYRNLKNPKRDMGLVAAAGPVSNFIIAILLVILARIVFPFLPAGGNFSNWVFANFQNGVMLSVTLGVFNLLPILPLDGGRILVSLLPTKYSIEYQKTEQYGFYILMALIFIGPMLKIDIIRWYFDTVMPYVLYVLNLFA
ncbi:MAG: site-2 protease family protein [Lactobacillales bacterium]|jgi:Zn-dependent protease|nr:site-2 protease family protein [Lactobacillales bacterium]